MHKRFECFFLGVVAWVVLGAGQVPATSADAQTTRTESWSSPDHKFLAYEIETAGSHIRMGKRNVDAWNALVLKSADAEGGLYLGSYKYFYVHWSPDSKYLVILKGYLTHNCDVDVYRVETSQDSTVVLHLLFRRDALSLPDGASWVNWDFKSWDLVNDCVTLIETDENPRTYRSSTIRVPLNGHPIRTTTFGEQAVKASDAGTTRTAVHSDSPVVKR